MSLEDAINANTNAVQQLSSLLLSSIQLQQQGLQNIQAMRSVQEGQTATAPVAKETPKSATKKEARKTEPVKEEPVEDSLETEDDEDLLGGDENRPVITYEELVAKFRTLAKKSRDAAVKVLKDNGASKGLSELEKQPEKFAEIMASIDAALAK